MKPSEIVHIFALDAIRYDTQASMVKAHVKKVINQAIDNSEWLDGFETAVKAGELDHYEYLELIEVLKESFPELIIEKKTLIKSLYENLPNFFLSVTSSWVTTDTFLILTDDLFVGKYQNNKLCWVTPRISLDGIIIEEVTESTVKGLCWLGDFNHNDEPDFNRTFEINIEDGSIIKGEIVDDKFICQ